ncbi:putative transporter C11D3.18C like protein [Verticillium longisporum]|nr:putative transporter C11D3.18C like protein [Verticillium longisporum]
MGGLLAYCIGLMDGVAGLRAWRWIIIIEGIPTVILGVTIWWWLADTPDTAHYLSTAEKDLIDARLRRQVGHTKSGDEFHKEDAIAGFKDLKIWLFCLGQFGGDVILYGYSTFLPTIISGLGDWDRQQVQALTIPCYATGAITYLVVAWLSDRMQRRAMFAVVSGLVCTVGYAILVSNASGRAKYFGCFVGAMGLYVVVGIPLAWLPSNNPRYGKRTVASGLQLAIGNSAGIPAPFLYATSNSPRFIKGHAISMAFVCMSSVIYMSFWAYFRFLNKKRDERKGDEKPASIQINGLIGAWQRSGGADDLQKADKLAWDMVRARIRFVDARRRLAGLEGGAYTKDAKTSSIHEADPMPKATLETFSLLAENYRVRRLQKPMEDLWVAFREAEISPDAFMLNQLMESHSQFGDIDEAQGLYRSLVHERGVKPDPYTFMALWKMIGVNRLQILSEDRAAGEIRLTRETFAETVRFAHVFKGQSLDGQLARKMLHTFRRLKDNLGLVVAMRALRGVFGYVPPEVLGLEMVIGTTNLAWDTATARQKLRLAKRKIDKWVEGRQKQLGRPVRTLDEMTPEERGQEMMEYLESEYLPAARNVEADLADVAREMGVYDIVKNH